MSCFGPSPGFCEGAVLADTAADGLVELPAVSSEATRDPDSLVAPAPAERAPATVISAAPRTTHIALVALIHFSSWRTHQHLAQLPDSRLIPTERSDWLDCGAT